MDIKYYDNIEREKIEKEFINNDIPETIQILYNRYTEKVLHSIIFIFLDIEFIGVSYLKIEYWPNCLFLFNNLKKLDISNNKLSRIPSHLIINTLYKLEEINLSNNLLHIFEDIQIFGYLHNLCNLNISNNPLPYLFNNQILIGSLLCISDYVNEEDIFQYPRNRIFPKLKVINNVKIDKDELVNVINSLNSFKHIKKKKNIQNLIINKERVTSSIIIYI